MLRPVGSKDLKRLVSLRVLMSRSIERLAATYGVLEAMPL